MSAQRLWILLGFAAAVAGLWWTFRPRSPAPAPAPAVPYGPLPLLAPPAGAYADPYQSYAAALGAYQQSPGNPYSQPAPIPPTGSNLKGGAIAAGGYIGAALATSACVGAGGGPLCALAAPVGKIGGQIATQGVIYAGGKAVDASKYVATQTTNAVKKVADVLKFW